MNQTLRVPVPPTGHSTPAKDFGAPAARRNKRFVALAVEACNLPLVPPAARAIETSGALRNWNATHSGSE